MRGQVRPSLIYAAALLGALASAGPASAEAVPADRPPTAGAIPLGRGCVPGAPAQEIWYKERGLWSVRDVSEATLTPYLPAKEKATGAGVIIAPGGAFLTLAMGAEGEPLAKWFTDHGIAAFVLKYRIRPTPVALSAYAAVMQHRVEEVKANPGIVVTPQYSIDDAIAALRLVRSRPDWGVDPHRLGMIGFSAGARLSRDVALTASADDEPSFIGPIYGPMYAVTVPPQAPPLFTVLAADDPLFAHSGFGILDSWIKAGKPAELHVFQSGGHGFSVGRPGETTATWLDTFLVWLRQNRFVQAK